jgi:hypothetical protein
MTARVFRALNQGNREFAVIAIQNDEDGGLAQVAEHGKINRERLEMPRELVNGYLHNKSYG